MGDLVERLRRGVPVEGLHEDNETELFDVDAANETMIDAKDEIELLNARIELIEGNNRLLREADEAKVKHIEAQEAEIARLRGGFGATGR